MPSKKKTLKEIESEFVAATQADISALKALRAKFDAKFKELGIDLSEQKTPRKR
jgi:hypothetical protein